MKRRKTLNIRDERGVLNNGRTLAGIALNAISHTII
jgi:hypothetical protein